MVGIDIVDIDRLRVTLARTPRLANRLFTESELIYARGGSDPAVHLAGMLAAKEATVKALGLSSLAKWTKRIEIRRDDAGKPFASLLGLFECKHVSISISHDRGVATAVAFAIEQEGKAAPWTNGSGSERIPPLVFTPQMELHYAEMEASKAATPT